MAASLAAVAAWIKMSAFGGMTRSARHRLVAQALLKESDRGCVLMGATLLDEGLEDLLRAALRRKPEDRRIVDALFAVQGPLSSFWSKIQLAYALGLVERKDYGPDRLLGC